MGRSGTPLSRRTGTALAAFALVALATVVVVVTRDDSGTSPQTRSGFRVVYRIEDHSGSTPRVTTETVEVDRPYRSRRTVRDGDTLSGGSIVTETGVYTVAADGGVQLVAEVLPAEAGSDLRLATSLAWAAGRALVQRDGSGSVLGRACTWWVSRSPLDTATLNPATTDEITRNCVDDSGLLLEDEWRIGNELKRRRRATEVGTAPDLSGAAVFAGATPKPLPAALRITVVEPAAPSTWLVAPPGLRADRTARATEFDPTVTPPEPMRVTARTVFTSATDVVLLDEIRSFSGPPRLGDGTAVSLGLAGRGVGRATPAGLVIELVRGDRLYRVRGSVAAELLVAWLTGLQFP